ncbi:hypothetical protein FAEUMB_10570 [Faecalimonas umbilicata]|uniref:Uncharacterized protein n=1 Tax=Faecalimonas umbilicata TaxID=1912855 RepID=A0ABN2DLM0_9FIRM|nr:hypothetical protein FAEUMB_10570 [Faecalimonas umbilicata]
MPPTHTVKNPVVAKTIAAITMERFQTQMNSVSTVKANFISAFFSLSFE